ncbi:hypothetical protein BaRGS_00017280 [Batillaria attramentaria]|uniref:Secreted protein n=1 Tax=Batillaria attramentaria TaxID=370345 RepID=A0ABD0KWP7_9CAEN
MGFCKKAFLVDLCFFSRGRGGFIYLRSFDIWNAQETNGTSLLCCASCSASSQSSVARKRFGDSCFVTGHDPRADNSRGTQAKRSFTRGDKKNESASAPPRLPAFHRFVPGTSLETLNPCKTLALNTGDKQT